MSVSRRKWDLAKVLKASGALVVTVFPPLAAADGGDDFSNNLFSDMAPILALFGEQVAKQFMSQSMGWADNILFAMAPLGVITAIVGAIRVAGPPILKVIVGRAKENRAAAEVDLMSSTSHDVCELWNGQMVVRMMGSPPVMELIFIPSRKDEPDCGLLTLGEPTECLVPRSQQGEPDTEAATPQGEPIGDTPKSAPNIFLNLYPTGSRRSLRLLAGFAIALQLGVLVFSGFVSYWFKLKKKDRILSYGYPLTAAGTVLLVIGMLICSHVVEQSTVEQSWDIKPKPRDLSQALGPRILWLQRGGYINDQNFSSFCIFGRGARDSILTSRRREAFEEDSTLFIRFYSRIRRLLNRNWEGPSTSSGSEEYLKFLVVMGTMTGVFGFVIQFTGLRGMHWSASIAQLVATLVMAVIRAVVRLGIANPPPTQRIPDGHELDWLATRIGGDTEPLWASLDEPKQTGDPREAPAGILDEKCWNWSLVTGVRRDKFASLNASQFDSGPNDVVRIRQRLGRLSSWTGPASKFAVSVAGSVEAVMNTIFTQKEYPELKSLEWSVYCRGGSNKPGKINLSVKRVEDNRWVACAAEIEAVLSLWLYSTKESETNAITDSALSADGARGDWLRHGQAAVQQRAIRLLGGNEEYYCQDLQWYLGDGVGIISQVQVEESPISEMQDPASPTSRVIEIETRNIVGFTNPDSEIGPNRQRLTRFRTQAIRPYSSRSETTPKSPNGSGQIERYDHLAVVSDSQLELLLAQDLFSSFMWDAAHKMQTLSVESTLHQTDQIQQTDSAWFDSLRLTNTALSSMAKEIERAGLGKPEDAYASIIPALSIKRKLPIPHCLIMRARERAQIYVANENWKGATNVYSKLLGISITFGKTSPLAVEATATVYEGLRAARARKHLWERWLHSPTMVEELGRRELGLRKALGTADEQVVLNLRIMHKFQCPRGDGGVCTGGIGGHQEVVGSGPDNPLRDRIIGFSSRDKCCLQLTDLHCAVLTDNWLGIDRFLESVASVDAKDVLGWTPLHYAATQGLRGMAETLLSTKGSAGADPNVKDFAGRTALHHAGGAGHEEVVRLLLQKGAYIGAEDNHHSTPLHIAAQNGHSNTAQVLLAGGADKESVDKFGYRPLHCAANSGHPELVNFLLQKNADKESEDQKRQTPLHHAAYNGHVGVVHLLLKNGADKEAKNHLGDTPLHHAATNGRLEVARLLLEKGGDKEAKSRYSERPLHYAAEMGHLDIVQLFLEKGADKEAKNITSKTPLHHAADHGHFDIVQLLLERGANKEAEAKGNLRPLHYAASSGNPEVVRLLLEEGADKEGGLPDGSRDSRPLHFAAKKGCLDMVRLLLEDGANKEAEDYKGNRPLHYAACYGHLEVVRLLLEEGANKEAEGSQRDRPLHGAAGGGCLDVVRLLLENGADKEAADSQGDRPLHRAAHYGQPEVVRLLLQKDANMEAEDNQGRRPLHRAAGCGRLDVVQLLLEKGADKEAQDNQGYRPLQIAINRGRSEVVQLLRGAKGKKGLEPEACC